MNETRILRIMLVAALFTTLAPTARSAEALAEAEGGHYCSVKSL
jgi:hypothetical protein